VPSRRVPGVLVHSQGSRWPDFAGKLGQGTRAPRALLHPRPRLPLLLWRAASLYGRGLSCLILSHGLASLCAAASSIVAFPRVLAACHCSQRVLLAHEHRSLASARPDPSRAEAFLNAGPSTSQRAFIKELRQSATLGRTCAACVRKVRKALIQEYPVDASDTGPCGPLVEEAWL